MVSSPNFRAKNENKKISASEKKEHREEAEGEHSVGRLIKRPKIPPPVDGYTNGRTSRPAPYTRHFRNHNKNKRTKERDEKENKLDRNAKSKTKRDAGEHDWDGNGYDGVDWLFAN